jgi:hypothetical protein
MLCLRGELGHVACEADTPLVRQLIDREKFSEVCDFTENLGAHTSCGYKTSDDVRVEQRGGFFDRLGGRRLQLGIP